VNNVLCRAGTRPRSRNFFFRITSASSESATWPRARLAGRVGGRGRRRAGTGCPCRTTPGGAGGGRRAGRWSQKRRRGSAETFASASDAATPPSTGTNRPKSGQSHPRPQFAIGRAGPGRGARRRKRRAVRAGTGRKLRLSGRNRPADEGCLPICSREPFTSLSPARVGSTDFPRHVSPFTATSKGPACRQGAASARLLGTTGKTGAPRLRHPPSGHNRAGSAPW
jgi:hypothetical protein